MSIVGGLIKSGLSSAVGQVTRANPMGQISSGLNSFNIVNSIPKPEIPSEVKAWGMEIKNNVKIPDEVKTNVIEPVKNAVSNIKIPGGIEGLNRANLPDLATVAKQAETKLSSIGIDTGGLGISTIISLMKSNGDPTALIKSMDLGIDMPDMSTSMGSFKAQAGTFDEAQMQAEIDQIMAGTGVNMDFNIASYL